MSNAELRCGEAIVDKRLLAALQHETLQLASVSAEEGNFPGSQPVSFERKHLQSALGRQPYYAAEKTDGVRYMLLAGAHGAYLVDRKFNFRRVRLHLPSRADPRVQVTGTLLDGELVEDHDERGSGKRTLRYLVYDAVAVHHKLLLRESLPMRLLYAHKYAIAPRALDRRHSYAGEPFTVELKAFYDIAQLRHVFERVIPELHHENDGIIFTPVAESYVVGTCHTLLKWKPSHMNTVDFKLLTVYRQRQPRYQLCAAKGGTAVFYCPLDTTAEEAAQLAELDNRIIECYYDPEWTTTEYDAHARDWSTGLVTKGGWRYMRPREDKHIPNDEGVVTKVIRSIKDNVTQEELLVAVDELMGEDDAPAAAPDANSHGHGAGDAAADSETERGGQRPRLGEPGEGGGPTATGAPASAFGIETRCGHEEALSLRS
jgi:hypothetical protein